MYTLVSLNVLALAPSTMKHDKGVMLYEIKLCSQINIPSDVVNALFVCVLVFLVNMSARGLSQVDRKYCDFSNLKEACLTSSRAAL